MSKEDLNFLHEILSKEPDSEDEEPQELITDSQTKATAERALKVKRTPHGWKRTDTAERFREAKMILKRNEIPSNFIAKLISKGVTVCPIGFLAFNLNLEEDEVSEFLKRYDFFEPIKKQDLIIAFRFLPEKFSQWKDYWTI